VRHFTQATNNWGVTISSITKIDRHGGTLHITKLSRLDEICTVHMVTNANTNADDTP